MSSASSPPADSDRGKICSYPVRQTLTAEEIVGRAFSTSVTSPERLGEAKDEFAAALTQALRDLSPDGTFTEVAELVGLLARRP